ncbi:MAG: GAF domain-containing protein, partial [Bdellovibrionales bacterium]|nr:GAF domain-containing protein [Bdellovibrionales bacterium]
VELMAGETVQKRMADSVADRLLIQNSGRISIDLRLARQLIELLDADFITIGALSAGRLVLQEVIGESAHSTSRLQEAFSGSPCQLVLGCGRFLSVGEIRKNTLLKSSDWHESIQVQSYIGVPLASSCDRLTGVLGAHGMRSKVILHSERRLLEEVSSKIIRTGLHHRITQDWVLQNFACIRAIADHRSWRLCGALIEGSDLRLLSQIEDRLRELPIPILAGSDSVSNSWFFVSWNMELSELRRHAERFAQGMDRCSISVAPLEEHSSSSLNLIRALRAGDGS